jgi:uncharacterized protein (TIGR02231 family)
MKGYTILLIILLPFAMANAKEIREISSTITTVVLYQNQAEITRSLTIKLPRGTSTIAVTGLPRDLQDWSAKAGLPKGFPGKILSVEITKKALVLKRKKKILAIEKKLQDLREADQVLIDRLYAIKKQFEFLNSIIDFTNLTAKKELQTRIPRIEVWSKTMSFTDTKLNKLNKEKRMIEKKREIIGKKIQQLEFDLRQIAGNNYYRNFRTLNDALLTNRASLNIQKYSDTDQSYAERKRFLIKPEGNVEYDKRFIISIYSATGGAVPVTITYLTTNTSWGMIYDLRANMKKKTINLAVNGNIYQKTGEDWNNIDLTLSTGSPVGSIGEPYLVPWYLSVQSRLYRTKSSYPLYKQKKLRSARRVQKMSLKEEKGQPVISRRSGSLVIIHIPMKQTVNSSLKKQKKFIKQFTLGKKKPITTYYECVPSSNSNSYLKAEITNTTHLPWLPGRTQIFLDNQFTGNSTLPLIHPGSSHTVILNMEPGVSSTKNLVKKYEDTSGLFGTSRKIIYSYQLKVSNKLETKSTIVLKDIFPVSQDKKITIKIDNLSSPFINTKKEQKSADFQRGIRQWKFSLEPRQEKVITYNVIITFDKKMLINGLK